MGVTSLISGQPFETLGCLNVQLYSFDTLSTSGTQHYAAYPPERGALVQLCSPADLRSRIKSVALAVALQRVLGSSRLQLRFQFERETDEDGEWDIVDPDIRLEVHYVPAP
jgi:hypothetical protein